MAEPPWLDEHEDRAWRGYVRMRWLLDQRLARDLARSAGLSDADYTVLAALSESAGHRLRLVELADRMLWSKSRLSHHVTRMEQRDLVRREEHAAGPRAVEAVLTDHGLATIRTAAPEHVASVRAHFLDLLTDEQITAIGDATDAVIGHLRALR